MSLQIRVGLGVSVKQAPFLFEWAWRTSTEGFVIRNRPRCGTSSKTQGGCPSSEVEEWKAGELSGPS